MTLYQVIADDYSGEPHGLDLFVRADTPQQAVEQWRDYYSEDKKAYPLRVDEIPVDGPGGAIRWEDVPCVWWPPSGRPT